MGRIKNSSLVGLVIFLLMLNHKVISQERYLIRKTNVVDVERGVILKNQYVLIEDGMIKWVSAIKPIGSFDQEVQGAGKYLVPGLINMYTHVNEDNLALYLANGITAVRDAPSHLTALGLREKVLKGELLGPRIFAVGLRATGMPAPYQSQQPIRTSEEAIQQVREAKRLGYDGMFVYGSCDADTYLTIIEEAKILGLQISGHYPQNVPINTALNSIQTSFDNLSGLTVRGNLKVDKEELINGLINTGQAIIPTLTVHRLWSLSDKNDSIFASIPKEYIPNKMKANWLPIENGSGSYPYSKVANLIKEFYQRGVNLFIGSDGGYPMVVNGFSFHQELQNFSELGIPNKEILKIATINSARFLGWNDLGLVKESYRADLLLIDGNPFEDLDNLKSISYIFTQGKPTSKKELYQILSDLKERIANPTNRFALWHEQIKNHEIDSALHYTILNNGITVGEEIIWVDGDGRRNFNLESINVMDGPDGRQTYMFARIQNRQMDTLEIHSITPEGTYKASISTTKTKAIISGTAPFHGDFEYEEVLVNGTLLLGPFTSRYYELDLAANYLLATILKRSDLENGQADQLPIIQIELNSEEFGKQLIIDKSEYTVLKEADRNYKIIYNTFSGYRSITHPSFVIDIQVDESNNPSEIRLGNRKMILNRLPSEE